jgi:hypothetical protein
MAKEQADKAVTEDETFKKDAEGKLLETAIGEYTAKPSLEFNSKGFLCSITLKFAPVEEYSIVTAVQKEADYFYDVFLKKYGTPVYSRPKSFSESIGVSDFKENGLTNIYCWANGGVTRAIALGEEKPNYYLAITITDSALKEKTDKTGAEKDQKKKQVEDF